MGRAMRAVLLVAATALSGPGTTALRIVWPGLRSGGPDPPTAGPMDSPRVRAGSAIGSGPRLLHSEEVEEDEVNVDWAYVVGIMTTALTFILGYVVERAHITWIPEAAIGLTLGMLAALAVDIVGTHWIEAMKFDFEFFMTILLPPIIFEAGYNMNVRAFFGNLGPTAFFAFVGTLASTFVVGGLVWYAGQLGWCYPLGLLASLTFGSLISATDPVTVLAVFQKLGVKVDLFSMVFGESVLNDAVAIVLSRTLLSFSYPGTEVNAASIQAAVVSFVVIFVGSSLLGIAFGVVASLIYKYLGLRMHKSLVHMEVALTFVFPWAAYYTTEALELSGIVSIMMAGIVMALFLRNSLSEEAATITSRVYKTVAQLAETYVFVYLGMAFVAFPIFAHLDWKLVFVALGACFVGRLHILVGSWLTNCLRGDGPGAKRISGSYMFLMWFSGLRGGVAFALASVIYHHDNFGAHCGGLNAVEAAARGEACALTDSLAILQMTLLIAGFTIFVFGGAITDVAIALGVLEDTSPQGLKKARMQAHVGKDDLWTRIDNTLTPYLAVGKMNKRVANIGHVKKVLLGESSGFIGDEWYFRQENEWALARVLDHVSAAQAAVRGRIARKKSQGRTLAKELMA